MTIKMSKGTRHYYYFQCITKSGRWDGLSLQQHGPKRNVHELCCLPQQIFISLTLPQNLNVIKNDVEEANSHYPPLTPPTSNILGSSYSQQPKLHLEKTKRLWRSSSLVVGLLMPTLPLCV